MLTLLGFGKDLSKEKAGNVSEHPPKQGGSDRTNPADQSTQNNFCIVPKYIHTRFLNSHTSLCNSLHTCRETLFAKIQMPLFSVAQQETWDIH